MKLVASLLCAFATGIVLFFWGWECLKRKRFIEDIPTSKVRSVAMGLAEVKGKAVKKEPIAAPYSTTPCVYYKYKKEKYVCHRTSRGRRYHSWQTIDQGESIAPFYLQDETGTILVEPDGIDLYGERRYYSCDGTYEGAFRYSEWFVLPGEEVYLLGSAGKSEEVRSERKIRLLRKLDELKKNKELLTRFDADKDGNIDSMEWEIASRTIEQELANEDLQKEFNDLADVSLCRGNNGDPFIISEYSEKKLTRSLGMKSLAGVFGGAALSLFALHILISKYGILFLNMKLPF